MFKARIAYQMEYNQGVILMKKAIFTKILLECNKILIFFSIPNDLLLLAWRKKILNPFLLSVLSKKMINYYHLLNYLKSKLKEKVFCFLKIIILLSQQEKTNKSIPLINNTREPSYSKILNKKNKLKLK